MNGANSEPQREWQRQRDVGAIQRQCTRIRFIFMVAIKISRDQHLNCGLSTLVSSPRLSEYNIHLDNLAFVSLLLIQSLLWNVRLHLSRTHLTEIEYREVAGSRLSQLIAYIKHFRLFMKGKFDSYVLWPLAKNFTACVEHLTITWYLVC